MEILTVQEQKEDWIALLRKEVRKKELVLTHYPFKHCCANF